jgi:hypothetical protein
MSATFNAIARQAMTARQDCAKPMPFSMHPSCMDASPDYLMIETGVLASVSLFVLVQTHTLVNPLLVSLVVLISLILIDPIGLSGLVGLVVGLDPGVPQGE